ncbi:hypothetical protein AcW1_008194 [Taiwanofungus camphoratus]|nr:hypothetical protein AcW1_008194 [Antrodia cinnamomea]
MPPKFASASRTPSQPAANGHSSDGGDAIRTKILLLGLRRSGKTSIQQVVFNDLPPKQTFYLERTNRVTRHTFDTIIPLEIWDCPGDTTLETLETLDEPLAQFATLIFVIDIQDLYQPSIARLLDFVIKAYQKNPDINLEVFVHKADTMSEEYRIDNFRYIQQRVLDELLDISIEYEQIPINFQLTSIHDHSLHDAFSRALHKSIESLPYLEDLLNVFCANSQSSKAFLFDIKSRLYVATDASPVDPPTHNLCNDYLLMLNSFGPLYKSVSASPLRHQVPTPPSTVHSPSPSTPISPMPPLPVLSAASQLSSPAPKSPLLPSLVPHQLRPARAPSNTPNLSTLTGALSPPLRTPKPAKPLFYPSASTTLSVGAGAGTTLTYHRITQHLALLALLPTAVFEARRGLVEYNVVFFREGVQEICQVEDEVRGGG